MNREVWGQVAFFVALTSHQVGRLVMDQVTEQVEAEAGWEESSHIGTEGLGVPAGTEEAPVWLLAPS